MSVLSKEYNACIYARLSRDDGDKLESDSIINQKALIRDFISKHPEIHVVSENTDDGYSGVNFDRPAFQEMMEDIRSGKINCVVVKDDCVIIEPTQKDLENQGFVAGSICF